MAPRAHLSETGTPHTGVFGEATKVCCTFRILHWFKSPIEGAALPWSFFKYALGATKDGAGEQKDDACPPGKSFRTGTAAF